MGEEAEVMDWKQTIYYFNILSNRIQLVCLLHFGGRAGLFR